MTVSEAAAALRFIAPVVMLLTAVCALSYLTCRLHRRIIRESFEEKHSIKLPREVDVRKGRKADNCNCFTLEFPSWLHQKKDGCCDNRYSDNYLIWGNCKLFIDGYRLRCYKPDTMIWIVNLLRSTGCQIDMHPLEMEKRNRIKNKRAGIKSLRTAQAIVAEFENEPTKFEEFCASLFEDMGWKAETTPKTNDGGFDIKLSSSSGDTCIVECKCYSETAVGRPALQKLAGANITEHARRMMFITTSSFSRAAVDYAKEVDIELVDGRRLVAMIKRYRPVDISPCTVDISDWSLNSEDLGAFCPPDCRGL